MSKVITYQTPFQGRTIQLCAAHANADDSGYRLGAISHGLHEGTCEVCQKIYETNEELVVLESMPAQHRASHRAANNFGTYPHNGSARYVMPRVEAEEVVDSDQGKYDRIVRVASDKDIAHYGTESRPEGW